MQKILATRSPREASLMSAFVNVVLYFPRYLLVAGFVVLGLLFYGQLNLTSAFVGTFSGSLNAAQAYAVNDLYMKYINPKAPNSRIAMVNYGTGVVIVVLSMVLGVFAQNVNSLLQWIVSALCGSYVASNMLKWYWWRSNSHGYFWGMVTGLVPALVVPLLWPDVLPLYYFPHLLGVSVAGCLLGTFLTKPTDEETLKSFYRTVRLWGAWGPIRKLVEAEDPRFERNRDFKRDMVNVFVGMIWQTAVAVAILAVASVFLKKNWYDRLPAQ